jgi:signal transduction histidine kinase
VHRYLQETDSVKNFRSTKLVLLNEISDTSKYPVYKDTLIYIEELEENQLHRQKTSVIEANGKFYMVSMIVNINDFTKLQEDIAHRIFPSFIILALIIILFSALMSGYLLNPFHRILLQMNRYKVGKGVQIQDINSSTLEFKKLQYLFKRMVNRIETDYRNLKEYTENMAHEIQTPLTIIRNKVERLISDESVMQAHKDSVKAIYNEANHLSKLGNTLNLLTKIENGEYTNSENLNTSRIIIEHVDSIKELVDLKSLKIDVSLDSEHQLLMDPFLFDIILKNLLRNAIRYASNQGPIKIETSNNVLKISNYGEELGVNEQKIFERFYTSDHSNQSLGLGLALVKRICDLNQLQLTYTYSESQHVFAIKSNT